MVPDGQVWARFDTQQYSQLQLQTICQCCLGGGDESGVASEGGEGRGDLYEGLCPHALPRGELRATGSKNGGHPWSQHSEVCSLLS